MGRVYMHLTYDQRLAIKQMLERGNSKKEIAESIGVHTSTIYREIDRGTVNGHYDPTAAEEAYQEKLAEKGPTAVLEENPELVNKDPYGEGWLIKVKPTDIKAVEDLLDAEAYKAVVNG